MSYLHIPLKFYKVPQAGANFKMLIMFTLFTLFSGTHCNENYHKKIYQHYSVLLCKEIALQAKLKPHQARQNGKTIKCIGFLANGCKIDKFLNLQAVPIGGALLDDKKIIDNRIHKKQLDL